MAENDSRLPGLLRGRQEIIAAYGRSWKIIKQLIDEEGFPAHMEYGEWWSTMKAINDWVVAREKKPHR